MSPLYRRGKAALEVAGSLMLPVRAKPRRQAGAPCTSHSVCVNWVAGTSLMPKMTTVLDSVGKGAISDFSLGELVVCVQEHFPIFKC